MKWWKLLALLPLLWLVFGDYSREDTHVGTITAISDLADSAVPMKKAMLQTNEDSIEVDYYVTDIEYSVGDKVILDTEDGTTTIADYYRSPAILKLFAIFITVVLLISDWAGVRSLLGLAFSFAILFRFLLPQMAAGTDPLVATLSASLVILFVSYYLTHGTGTKTTIAIIGTFISLICVGILASLFGTLTHLTGYGAEEASFISGVIGRDINVYGLLMAGMIIGALGVLDDITISQTSVVEELKRANNKLGMTELYVRAMHVGRDHISSLVNTLVLVYTGSALPLLILFVGGQQSWASLINFEPVAEEIVRTLVGSIGLVAAVPITTLIAAYWYGVKR